MLILLLAGCGAAATDAAPSPAPGTAAPVWEGEGGSFVAEDIVLPEDAYFNTLTLSAGELYYASYSETASELYRGSVRIYTSAGMIEYLVPAKDGVWVVERLPDGFAAKRLCRPRPSLETYRPPTPSAQAAHCILTAQESFSR